jgi:hypothetical protein
VVDKARPFKRGDSSHSNAAGGASPRADTEASVLDDLVDPVDHARDMPAKLKEECPEHLEAWSILDEDRKKWQKEAEDDQQNLHQANSPRIPALEGTAVPGFLVVSIALFSSRLSAMAAPGVFVLCPEKAESNRHCTCACSSFHGADDLEVPTVGVAPTVGVSKCHGRQSAGQLCSRV